ACLAKEPERRPRSTEEVLKMLNSTTDNTPLHWQYVFTNRVGNGPQIETEEERSAIAAEFLSPKVLVAVRHGRGARQGFNFPKRSRRFLTFSLRRLSIEDTEIREFLTYRFARQAVLQLRFNHWDDSHGFRSEPRPFDFRGQVSEKATLE